MSIAKKAGVSLDKIDRREWLDWRHTLRCNNTSAATARKCCVSELGETNDGKVRIIPVRGVVAGIGVGLITEHFVTSLDFPDAA